MAMRVYLPLALMGSPKLYQMSHKSLTVLGQEWEHLGQEMRAAQAPYTHTGTMGQMQTVLMQPTQATRIIELPVPWIQLSELHLKDTGVMLKDQVMAQNLLFFGERECERQQQPGDDAVTTLVSTLSGETPPIAPLPPPLPIMQQQPPAMPQLTGEMAMNVEMDQGDGEMTDGTGAQQ